jgi:hypothetical protein
VLDDQPVRMELPKAFSKRMSFLEDMSGLIQSYREGIHNICKLTN